jgi:ATP-dependent Clp protease protease subunit
MYKTDIIGFFKRRKLIKQIQSFTDFVDLSANLNREIYLTTITAQTAEAIDRIVRMWNYIDDTEIVEFSKRHPIKIYMNSLGGDFNAMLTIMDVIKMSKTPVQTINIGVVQKEAFFIYAMGHQRYAYPRATFLYERDLKHLDNSDEQTDKYVNFYLRQLDEIKDLVIEKTKITENEYNKHLKACWWMSAEDAHKLRVCTEILYTTVLR